MSDKELADAVVALGVGSHDLGYPANLSTHGYAIGGQVMSIITFTTDWRVAGALMERVTQIRTKPLPIDGARYVANVAVGYEWSKGADDSLPRAIIEACVSALQEDKP